MDKSFLWEYLEGSTPTFFSKETTVQIEKEYKARKPSFELAPKTEINFARMEISKNGAKSPIKRITIDTLVAAMANKTLWQYEGDQGVYINYASDIDKVIETAHKAGLAKRGIFINNKQYIIDFVRMLQINPLSGFGREVKRNAKNELEAAKLNAIWTWLDDQNVFVPYDIKEMQILEEKYQKKEKKFDLSMGSFTYMISFVGMVQCNNQTKKTRSIRRIPLGLIADPVVWEYENSKGFVPYDGNESEFIEKAFKGSKAKYSGSDFNVNFKTMTWTNAKTKESGKVRRVNQIAPGASQFLWQYLSDDGYALYSVELNKKIEEAYQTGKPSLSFANRGVLYTLHFDIMEQEDARRQQYRAVRRLDETARKWAHYQSLVVSQQTQANCSLIALDVRSTECEIVKSYFDKTMKGKYKTMSVMKVNNPLGKSFYKAKLDEYEEANKKPPLVLLLFHGTKDTHPSKIYDSANESFDSKYSLKEEKWGKGIYFSSSAAMVCAGCEYKEKEKSYVIFAKVIVGEPQKFGVSRGEAAGFDSVRVENAEGDIYRVSEGNMAYPKYLIEYIT